MPQVGFELTIPVFERAKTFHALKGVATVIGLTVPYYGVNNHPYYNQHSEISSLIDTDIYTTF
jgi:hypothetical protein